MIDNQQQKHSTQLQVIGGRKYLVMIFLTLRRYRMPKCCIDYMNGKVPKDSQKKVPKERIKR